jgi:hypothetical protein
MLKDEIKKILKKKHNLSKPESTHQTRDLDEMDN